ncbi:MAG: NUDIX domain-containing protein [Patescibacteria group bacterium]|nr:NUDIX domain-containing protein [Patescibacteria group bacterium]
MIAGIDYTGVSVAFYCHDGQGNFLLQKRSQQCRDQKGRWDSGGGKLEFGESPEVATLREIKEEYGCAGQINRVLPTLSFFEEIDGQGKHWIIIPHIVEVNRDQVSVSDQESIDEIGWFRLSDFPSPLHDSVTKELVLFYEQLKEFSI